MSKTLRNLAATAAAALLVLVPGLASGQAATGAPAKLIITSAPASPSPSICLQLLHGDGATLHAVALDAEGRPVPIPAAAALRWTGDESVEVQAQDGHTAAVRLTRNLRAAVGHVTAELTIGESRLTAATEVAEKRRELPNVFVPLILRAPTPDARGREDHFPDGATVKVGGSVMGYLRGQSADMASSGELFMLPPESGIVWGSVPTPPMGPHFRFTATGCHAVRIEGVEPGQMFGTVRADVTLPGGATRQGVVMLEVIR